MNFKSEAYAFYNARQVQAKDKFERVYGLSVKMYHEALSKAFAIWTSAPAFSPSNKRKYLKAKCKALIQMDHQQITATKVYKATKAANRNLLNQKLEATKVATSAWFTGEYDERTYY